MQMPETDQHTQNEQCTCTHRDMQKWDIPK